MTWTRILQCTLTTVVEEAIETLSGARPSLPSRQILAGSTPSPKFATALHQCCRALGWQIQSCQGIARKSMTNWEIVATIQRTARKTARLCASSSLSNPPFEWEETCSIARSRDPLGSHCARFSLSKTSFFVPCKIGKLGNMDLGPLILTRCLILILCLQVRTKGGIFDWQRPFDPRKNAYGDIT